MSYTYKRMPEHLREAWEAFEKTLKPAIDLEGHSERRKEAFAQVRAELKQAQKHGIIPAFCKFSVRTDHNSLNVDLVQWEGRVFSDEYTEHLMASYARSETVSRFRDEDFDCRSGHLPRLVPKLEDVGTIAAQIANRHNFDRSDSMTDYFHCGYYLDVSTRDVETAAERAIQLECDPDTAKLYSEAVSAINSLHPSCREKICDSVFGRRGFESAGEWGWKSIIKLAERAQGRPMAYCKRSRGWRVVKEAAAPAPAVDDDAAAVMRKQEAAWNKTAAREFARRIPGGDHA